MALPLRLGTIIWAEIADPNGVKKPRPAVVVTPTDAIMPGGSLDLVAITSFIPDPLPDDHVLLPWHPQGHPRTGLNRKSAAVCNWVAVVSVDIFQSVAGVVPSTLLIEIMSKRPSP
jgi:mRNA-degrading endonuclease toxin of MazEF toxin-antitoxin module